MADNLPEFKRIVVKMSGEALSGNQSFGIDTDMLVYVAKEIESVRLLGVGIAIVIGGGNIFRGKNAADVQNTDRTSADYMGMLATMINALALRNALENLKINTRILSAVAMPAFVETYTKRKAVTSIENGEVLILGAGTGNPYFTTDTAAVLRALEIEANILLKATKVDGLYDSDPEINENAELIKKTDYMTVIKNRLNVMDMTAISLAMDNNLELAVFNMKRAGDMKKLVCGESIGANIRRKKW